MASEPNLYENVRSNVIPAIQEALRDYCKRYIALIEDEEIKRCNEFVKNDLLEHLGSIQYIISNMSKSKDFNAELGIIRDNKDIISNALSFYIKNLENSRETVKSKLMEESRTFSRLDKEIDKLKGAVDYVKTSLHN